MSDRTDSPADVPAPTVHDDAAQARANLLALAAHYSGNAVEIIKMFDGIPREAQEAAGEAALEATRVASAAYTAAMLPAPVAQTPADEPWVVVDLNGDTRPYYSGKDGDVAWSGWLCDAIQFSFVEALGEVRAAYERAEIRAIAVPLSRAADVARGSR